MKILKLRFEYLFGYGSDENKAKIEEQIRARGETFKRLGIHYDEEELKHPTVVAPESVLTELMLSDDKPSVLAVVADMASAEYAFKMALENMAKIAEHKDLFNERCNVHISGQALSAYNEVLLLEDACSDHLQDSLDKGWRIITACPTTDSRRPDYILGRFNPKREELTGRAERSP